MVIPSLSRLRTRDEVDNKDFLEDCISLANEIDAAIGRNEVTANVQQLPLILNHVCRRIFNDQTRAVVMVLMISAKNACQLGWFPPRESQELLALVNSMWKGFSSSENVKSSLYSLFSLIPQVMERFYPFVKLGHILVSFEAEPESNVLAKDFHISKKMPFSPKQKIGLFVFRTDDTSKSSCIIHPQKVSFLLNGKEVQNRAHTSMDSGPQLPTNVTALLNPGANLLQAIGCFGGSYFIAIAFMEHMPVPDKPLLRDYVHSDVIQSNSDGDIIEGPSRISLSCPISRTRIKLPVKGHVCKHLQCFDFWNYVEINRRRPSWRCPHCNQYVCYTDIRVDQNMIKILKEVHDAADVVISADGSWRVVMENDENMELAPETTHNRGDPNSFQNVRPAVLDLTRDENEMETSSGTQANEQKPCLSEIQGLSSSTQMRATDYTMLNQSSASMNAQPQLPQTLHAFDGRQRSMNLPRVLNTQDSAARQSPNSFLSTPSSQEIFVTNANNSLRTSMPAPQSSQFQGSHVTALRDCLGRTSDLMQRWSHIYGNATSQTQLPPTPPPLQHHHALQNQRLPIRSLSPAQQRPMPSSTTHPETVAVNYGRTSSEQRPLQIPNPGGAVEQFATQRELMDMRSANNANCLPQIRMRGSLMPGSTGYDHMIIRPTQQAQAQARTLPPCQPTAYNNNIADETQARTSTLPLAEGVATPGSVWSMPPELW